MYVEGAFGFIYVISIYWKFNQDIEPYLKYTLAQQSLQSDYVRETRRKREALIDCVQTKDLTVLNLTSKSLTFDGPVGTSVINVSLEEKKEK